MRPTALFHLYKGATALALPFLARQTINKLRRAGVSVDRAHERLGHATAQRRFGPLIWLHGASVGEAKSVLPLMARITADHPDARLLLTSGTATSAQAVASRLPPGAVHQFSPLDGTGPLQRFLRHWRPDLCVLVESELWPNLLDQCARGSIPIALLNARLSDKSAQGWARFPGTAAYVLRGIRMAHCQDARTRDNLRRLGLDHARHGANLKSLLGRPMVTATQLDEVHKDLAGRPIWAAASTHEGEEDAVIAAHKSLLVNHPDLCLILIPRHPERGNDVAALIANAGLTVAQRSTGGTLADGAQVYLADTMGETDLWYGACPIVFLGGSFAKVGGHTPFEPAAAHTAILHGPHYANFAEAYASFQLKDASVQVENSGHLADAVHTLLTHPSRAAQLAANAKPLVQDGDKALGEIAGQLFYLAQGHAMDGHA